MIGEGSDSFLIVEEMEAKKRGIRCAVCSKLLKLTIPRSVSGDAKILLSACNLTLYVRAGFSAFFQKGGLFCLKKNEKKFALSLLNIFAFIC